MRHRVHSGGCRQASRQSKGQLRIADRTLRHQMPGMETELAAVVDDDDGAARDLAAGAGRRRNRNQRRHLAANARTASFDSRAVCQRSGMGGRDRHCLGQVDRRAAAERNQAVGAVPGVPLHGLAHCGFGGVRRRAVVDGNAKVVERRGQSLQQPGGDHAAVRADERPGDYPRARTRPPLRSMRRSRTESR